MAFRDFCCIQSNDVDKWCLETSIHIINHVIFDRLTCRGCRLCSIDLLIKYGEEETISRTVKRKATMTASYYISYFTIYNSYTMDLDSSNHLMIDGGYIECATRN